MSQQMVFQLLLAIGSIFLIDVVLSGDNALVIGVVAATIPSSQRRLALILGSVGAMILRIVLASFTTLLLAIPFLRTVGGLVVLFITIQLLLNQTYREELPPSITPEHSSTDTTVGATKLAQRLRQYLPFELQRLLRNKTSRSQRHVFLAVLTIILADITMSVDNVVAIAALAKGQILVVVVGLLFSVILLFVGSVLVSEFIIRMQSLIVLASLILAWVVGNLLWGDLGKYFPHDLGYQVALYSVVYAIILLTFVARRIYLYLQVRTGGYAESRK